MINPAMIKAYYNKPSSRSGYMLQYYVDFSSPKGIDPTHSDWVGAWWTGFILAGIMAVLSAIPLIMFPRKLPEADEVMTMKVAQGKLGFK